MAKSVYYYWRAASSKADPYQDAKEHITQIFNAHQGRYGYRRVHLELRNQYQYLNHKTVQRLMGQLGLKSTVRPKRYQSYKGSIGKAAPNLLERNFGASKPNQKWVTDVTEFNIKALLKKPISELTPAEMRRRLEYAEAESAYLKKLEALAQSKAAKENKPK